MTDKTNQYDLTKITFGILFIAVFMISCFWIIQPFILGLTWAAMVVIATWPLMIRLQSLVFGKRLPAVLIMTLILMLFFVIPIALLINGLLDYSPKIIGWISDPTHLQFTELNWLKSIPVVGETLDELWESLIADGGRNLMAKVQPYVGKSASWFMSQVVNVSYFMLHASLMVLFSALLYYKGEVVGQAVRHFAVRLTPEKGDAVVLLAAQSIRAVALGVVVTALIQSIIGAIGLGVAGVPHVKLLVIIMFLCCIAQLGPLLVLVPSTIWLFWSGDTTWGIALTILSVVVAALDNVIRPALIKMGADLPFLLILIGAIGGILAFGMIGLFIGPMVLAVTYRLLSAWVNEVPAPAGLSPILDIKPENPSTTKVKKKRK